MDKWDGEAVFDAYTKEFLGYAVGEPKDDGVESYITLSWYQWHKFYRVVCCGHVNVGSDNE